MKVGEIEVFDGAEKLLEIDDSFILEKFPRLIRKLLRELGRKKENRALIEEDH